MLSRRLSTRHGRAVVLLLYMLLVLLPLAALVVLGTQAARR
jgi:hypothetical protein